jgi:SAM-dependent methyltransferase
MLSPVTIEQRDGPQHGLLNSEEIDAALRRSARYGRLYFLDKCGHLVKVASAALDPTSSLRINDLREESQVLKTLQHVKGVPRFAFVEERNGWQALGTDYVRGRALGGTSLAPTQKVSILWQTAWLLFRISLSGISHNDVKLENVLLSSKGRAYLLDFDQATSGHTPWRALVRNFIGSHFYKNEVVVHGSLRTLGRSMLKRRRLPQQRRMPDRREATTERQQILFDAWKMAQASDANAPGDGVAYYAITVDGMSLPGERSWKERWAVLSKITDVKGKRILELGCNLGLLSVYFDRVAGAAAVWGVDHDKQIIDAAKLVAKAYDSSAQFSVVDLMRDSDGVDELIAFKSDIAACLNVWNWIPDRSLLVRLLSSVPEIIYEGHESIEVEIDRLKQMGFARVEHVSTSERGRPVLHGCRLSGGTPR